VTPLAVESPDQLSPYLGELNRHHQKAPELMRLWIELAAAASRPNHPAHTYFVERYERGRAQFAVGFHDEVARSKLRGGLTPESAAVLFHPVLNGLQLQWGSTRTSTSSDPSTTSYACFSTGTTSTSDRPAAQLGARKHPSDDDIAGAADEPL
jgi:hypothetical protein